MYREQESSHLEWPDHTGKNRVNARKQNDLQFSDSNFFFWPGVQVTFTNKKKVLGIKNWCLWIVVLSKTLENPLDYKATKPVDPKGNQPWIFIGRIDAEAEAPILWPPDAKSRLTEKTRMLGKPEGKRRIGQQRMRWLDSITDSMDMNLSKPRR